MDVPASPALGLSRELALAVFPTLNPMRARYGGLSSFLARINGLGSRPRPNWSLLLSRESRSVEWLA
jgi:hypothetical protein